MKRIYENPLPSASEEQVEGALQRISNRLWSGPVVELRDPIVYETLLPAPARQRSWWVAAAAIAAAVVITVLVPARVVRSAPATLEDSAGSRRVQYGELVSPKGVDGGTLKLTNGSHVEMRSESELSVERVDDNVHIRVHRGDVIVNSAEPLVVETKDISASGRIFLVNAKEEGSRVAVIGGEARVQQGTTAKTLLPGEQVSTSQSMEPQTMAQEIAWSRNARAHMASLQQSVVLTTFQKPAAERVAFEEVSIRPRTPAPGGGGRDGGPSLECANTFQIDPQRFSIRNANVYTLIAMAYVPGSCLNARQLDVISGGPGWIRSEKFDIEALLPPGSPSYTSGQLWNGRGAEKLQGMLKTLLAERFSVVLHSEMKERSAYVLTNEGESKLKLWEAGKTVKDPETGKEVASGCGMRGIPDETGQTRSANLNCWNVPMGAFVNTLAFLAKRPVLDRTGLAGQFQFDLEFSNSEYTGTSPSSLPAVSAAVREQLGLKLETAKVPMEVLVIDRAEKPSEN